jgi:hypothetical protein
MRETCVFLEKEPSVISSVKNRRKWRKKTTIDYCSPQDENKIALSLPCDLYLLKMKWNSIIYVL